MRSCIDSLERSVGEHNVAIATLGFPFVRTCSPFGAGFDSADNEIPSAEGFADAIPLAAGLSAAKKL